MRKLQSTPKHLTSTLKNHATNCLKTLKHELDPEKGWLELLSLHSPNKEWIHKCIDKHYHLSRLFRKVSHPHTFAILYFHLGSQDMRRCSSLAYAHANTYLLSCLASPDLRILSRVSTTIPKEASGSQSRPLSMLHFAFSFLHRYLHCPTLPVRSQSSSSSWDVSCLRHSFRPSYPILFKRAIWRLWQGEFRRSLCEAWV